MSFKKYLMTNGIAKNKEVRNKKPKKIINLWLLDFIGKLTNSETKLKCRKTLILS